MGVVDKAIALTELKATIRRVRTPAGQRRYKQPIGSIIVRDSALSGLRLTGTTPDGWDVVEHPRTKQKFDVGQWKKRDGGDDRWYAQTHAKDGGWGDEVIVADDEDEVFLRLAHHLDPEAFESQGGSGGGSRSTGTSANVQAEIDYDLGGWLNSLQDHGGDGDDDAYDDVDKILVRYRSPEYPNGDLDEYGLRGELRKYQRDNAKLDDEQRSHIDGMIDSINANAKLPKRMGSIEDDLAKGAEFTKAKRANLNTPRPIKVNEIGQGMWIRPAGSEDWYQVRSTFMQSSRSWGFDTVDTNGKKRTFYRQSYRDKFETVGDPKGITVENNAPTDAETVLEKNKYPNLTPVESEYEDYEKFMGANGKPYYVGKKGRSWVVENEDDEVIGRGKSQSEAMMAANAYAQVDNTWTAPQKPAQPAQLTKKQAVKKYIDLVDELFPEDDPASEKHWDMTDEISVGMNRKKMRPAEAAAKLREHAKSIRARKAKESFGKLADLLDELEPQMETVKPADAKEAVRRLGRGNGPKERAWVNPDVAFATIGNLGDHFAEQGADSTSASLRNLGREFDRGELGIIDLHKQLDILARKHSGDDRRRIEEARDSLQSADARTREEIQASAAAKRAAAVAAVKSPFTAAQQRRVDEIMSGPGNVFAKSRALRAYGDSLFQRYGDKMNPQVEELNRLADKLHAQSAEEPKAKAKPKGKMTQEERELVARIIERPRYESMWGNDRIARALGDVQREVMDGKLTHEQTLEKLELIAKSIRSSTHKNNVRVAIQSLKGEISKRNDPDNPAHQPYRANPTTTPTVKPASQTAVQRAAASASPTLRSMTKKPDDGIDAEAAHMRKMADEARATDWSKMSDEELQKVIRGGGRSVAHFNMAKEEWQNRIKAGKAKLPGDQHTNILQPKPNRLVTDEEFDQIRAAGQRMPQYAREQWGKMVRAIDDGDVAGLDAAHLKLDRQFADAGLDEFEGARGFAHTAWSLGKRGRIKDVQIDGPPDNWHWQEREHYNALVQRDPKMAEMIASRARSYIAQGETYAPNAWTRARHEVERIVVEKRQIDNLKTNTGRNSEFVEMHELKPGDEVVYGEKLDRTPWIRKVTRSSSDGRHASISLDGAKEPIGMARSFRWQRVEKETFEGEARVAAYNARNAGRTNLLPRPGNIKDQNRLSRLDPLIAEDVQERASRYHFTGRQVSPAAAWRRALDEVESASGSKERILAIDSTRNIGDAYTSTVERLAGGLDKDTLIQELQARMDSGTDKDREVIGKMQEVLRKARLGNSRGVKNTVIDLTAIVMRHGEIFPMGEPGERTLFKPEHHKPIHGSGKEGYDTVEIVKPGYRILHHGETIVVSPAEVTMVERPVKNPNETEVQRFRRIAKMMKERVKIDDADKDWFIRHDPGASLRMTAEALPRDHSARPFLEAAARNITPNPERVHTVARDLRMQSRTLLGTQARFLTAIARTLENLFPEEEKSWEEAMMELKAFRGNDGVHKGAMIALIPTVEDQARLAMEGGEPAHEMHLTLRYLGDAEGLAWNDRVNLTEITRTIAAQTDRMQLAAFSVNLFNPTGAEPCLVIGVSDPEEAGLTKVKHRICEAVGGCNVPGMPKDHSPFVPHVTLKYNPAPEDLAEAVKRVGLVTFDRMRVVFGGETTDFMLQQGR